MPDEPRKASTILVMGFRPSPEAGGDRSGELLGRLAREASDQASFRTLLLPAGRDDALLKAVETMDHFLPDAVLVLGAADGEASLIIERAAANLDEPAPGSRTGGEPIDAAGPAGYFSTLPIGAMLRRMRAGRVPVELSTSGAGRRSNRLLYALLHYVALRGQETWFKRQPPAGLGSLIGAIEIPSSQRLPLETSLRGVGLALAAVADHLASPEGRSSDAAYPAAE